MGKFIDMTGRRYGRLIVLRRIENTKSGATRWICKCDCGVEKSVLSSNLNRRITTSCGCFQRERASKSTKARMSIHNMSHSRVYKSWQSMVQRCTNVRAPDYARYGGRGISICDKWRNSFNEFYNDMGDRPEGMQIDRIDNNGNYEPGNCRWVTPKDNCRNCRTNHIITCGDVSQTLAAWSEQTKLSRYIVISRFGNKKKEKSWKKCS